AAGFDPITVTDVDLRLEAVFGPTGFLIAGVKINAPVGIGLSHHVDFQFEILEGFVVAHIVKVATLAMRDKRAILDLPGLGMFVGRFPARERFPVEQRFETGLEVSACETPGSYRSEQKGQSAVFHVWCVLRGASVLGTPM